MAIKIALAGNPNCGKTTMFNDLTGSNQYVGNWPGVTVEKKEGKLKGSGDVVIQDLPGIYSLSPYTLEEVVARGYLVNEKPDAILNIVDATNIERNLYLTTQLAELGIPMVIALNMIDVTRKNGDRIDLKKLGEALGCEVIETSALKGEGSVAVAQKAAALAGQGRRGDEPHVFAGSVEHALAHIEDLMNHLDGTQTLHHHHADGGEHPGGIVDANLTRWYLTVPITSPVNTTLYINWSKVNTGAAEPAAGHQGANRGDHPGLRKGDGRRCGIHHHQPALRLYQPAGVAVRQKGQAQRRADSQR